MCKKKKLNLINHSKKIKPNHLDRSKVTLHKKMKFSIKDFFSKYDQIRSYLRIWSHLLKKSLMENFIFCAVEGARRCLFERNV